MSHTQGKLYADQNGKIWRRPPSDLYENGGGVAGDKPVFEANRGWYKENEEGYPVEANARHLVACWNACDRISTDDLEQSADIGLIRAIRAKNAVERQRDELLAALEAIADPDKLISYGEPMVLREFAIQAIAKAKND